MNAKSFLILSAGLLAATVAAAQNPAPEEAPLFVTAKADDRLDERIFPLGWSADGKFAWITRQVEEASEDGMWSLTVLDTATNKTVEEINFTLPEKGFNGVAKFWAKNKRAIVAVLQKHAVKTAPMVMDHFPVVLGSKRDLVVQADLIVEEGETVNGDLGVKSLKVSLRVGEEKSVILQKAFEDAAPFAVSIAGCFHSPDEKFGVVVVTILDRGYEGPPHPREVMAMAGFRIAKPE